MVGHVSPRDSVPGACRLTHHVILTGRLADSIYFYCFKASLLPLFVVAVLGFFFSVLFCLFCFESWFSTAQADLLPPSPKNWNYRFAAPHPAAFVMILEIVLFPESRVCKIIFPQEFQFLICCLELGVPRIRQFSWLS